MPSGAGEQAGGQVGDEERGDGLAGGGADGAQDGVVAGAVLGGEHGGDDGVDQGEADEEGGDGEAEGAQPVQVRDGGGERDRVGVVEGQARWRRAVTPVRSARAAITMAIPMVSPNMLARNLPRRRVAARSPSPIGRGSGSLVIARISRPARWGGRVLLLSERRVLRRTPRSAGRTVANSTTAVGDGNDDRRPWPGDRWGLVRRTRTARG